jgi:hypothetical protein
MMLSESEWIDERRKLADLMHDHPSWSLRAYAREVQHDLTWVRKWVKRLFGIDEVTTAALRSHSRRPKHSPKQLAARVKDAISEQREVLSERFNRAAGAKLIATVLGSAASLSSIYKTLKERGYIRPHAPVAHTPLVLPAPNEEWELDFGEIYLGPVEGSLEFLLVVDRGTSRVVHIEGTSGYRAESAIEAVIRLFAAHGLPKRLRFDRDPRLWGSWTRDSYPSPFIRLLHALSVEPIVCPPHRPDKKPMVERCIGTLKYEWLARYSPTTFADAHALLDSFVPYHNRLRPHQGNACQNRPPDIAFPNLPALPGLPERVTPNQWLTHEDQRVYRRRVNAAGSIQVDRHSYSIGQDFAGAQVLIHLDGAPEAFHITLNGETIRVLSMKGFHPGQMDLLDYVDVLKSEASFIAYHHALNWQQTGDTE